MKSNVFIAFGILSLFLAGCSQTQRIALEGPPSYSDCFNQRCKVPFEFDISSILLLESAGAVNATSIYYGGRIYLIGPNFKNLWVGKPEGDVIKFEVLSPISNTPCQKANFDWRNENLAVVCVDAEGYQRILIINTDGKVVKP